VVAAERRPRLDRMPRGLPGTASVRVLELDPHLWLIVTSAPSSRYGESVINRKLADLEWVSHVAMAHERVIEFFVDQPAVLPMKLFTIFASDERAVESLGGDRRRLQRLLKRVTNQREWGIRVMMNAAPRAATADSRARPRPDGGAAYLTRKKVVRDRSVEIRSRARDVVAALYDRLAARSTSAKRRAAMELQAAGVPLLLDAAFLVDRRRARAFQSVVAREQRALAKEGYRLLLTGPWPAYTFVQD
jgi:hypothetical protein